MAIKNFKVGFFVGVIGAAGRDGLLSQALQNLYEHGLAPDIPEADLLYQIRNLQSFNNGESFQGVFAKIRTSDIPHIGNTDGDEREIDLADDEGVIEKKSLPLLPCK